MGATQPPLIRPKRPEGRQSNAYDQLGAEADIARITALEAAALALCPDVDDSAAKVSHEVKVVDGGGADGGSGMPGGRCRAGAHAG